MSGLDRLLLIIHIGFAIFTLGPLTAATMATPRYIRRGDIAVVRYLRRATQLYGLLAIGIFLFGMFLGRGKFAQMWLTASMTLFIVALALLLILERDQGKAIRALEDAATAAVGPAASEAPAEGPAPKSAIERGAEPGKGPAAQPPTSVPPARAATVAQVERGRIASFSGVIALIWLVILVLMVWH